ncbi:MAG: type I methionyl aminopeptidase [Kiritimatiellia bacterium]|nr:type I methionyl aminopeptidase [Kiritimatiellia bacterium]
MIRIKTPAELERMRASNRLAARLRDELADMIRPGIRTADLEEAAVEWMRREGTRSAFKGYRGFPGHICASVNEEVVHGIPGNRRIELGDIVSLDVGVIFEGFVGDTARTVMVGVNDPDVVRLVSVTRSALEAALEAAQAGAHLSDISHAVERTATEAGFSVVREFVGHGIGRRMHEEPQIPNFGPPGRGPRLKPGMTLAIEPMINLGAADVETLADGWTVVTRDRRPSAHFEHTVAIGEAGVEILTVP